MDKEKIKVLLVKPYQKPQAIEIENGLKSLQKAVGGHIEVLHPFADNVLLICNEEGKINGLPLNRALRDNEGEVIEVIAGDFLLCGDAGDEFASLDAGQIEKYTEHFKHPEEFISLGGQIMAIPVPPMPTEKPAAETEKHPKPARKSPKNKPPRKKGGNAR